jgi:hypothetical protein
MLGLASGFVVMVVLLRAFLPYGERVTTETAFFVLVMTIAPLAAGLVVGARLAARLAPDGSAALEDDQATAQPHLGHAV